MAENFNQLDPIEEALVELATAENARLFERTRVDTRAMLAAPAQAERRRLRWLSRRVMLPVAAAVALAIGVSPWMFPSQFQTSGRSDSLAEPVLVADAVLCDGGFDRCMTGPGAGGDPGCGNCDYDADGDVDLADVRAYQLAFAVASR